LSSSLLLSVKNDGVGEEKKTVGARQSASQLAVEKISKVEEEVKKKIHPIPASIHPSIQQGIISS
jgi:hypothetical protein